MTNGNTWDSVRAVGFVCKVFHYRATTEVLIIAFLLHTLTLIRFCVNKLQTPAVNATLLCLTYNQSSRVVLQLLQNCMACSHCGGMLSELTLPMVFCHRQQGGEN